MDLIITLDDATSEHYSMFFVEEEGAASSFQAMRKVILKQGLPSSRYTDRGSHYWHTPNASGKVDKQNLTQFGRAIAQLGIEMIPAYSPEARDRCERQFASHQNRLPRELAATGISNSERANRYLQEHYLPAFNREFTVKPAVVGSAFVPFIGPGLDDILCEQYERTVNKDDCVAFEGKESCSYRRYYVKTRVRVNPYPDGHLALFNRPRKLACYTPEGLPFQPIEQTSANVRCRA